MHGAAVHDELPVGLGVVHLLREPGDVRERHVRIQSAVTGKHLGLTSPGSAGLTVARLPWMLTNPITSAPSGRA